MPTLFNFDPKNTTKIASTWCRLCNEKDFQSLAQYIAEFKKREGWIEKIFEKEGSFFLYNALLSSDEPDRFNFILKNISESIIAEKIAENDYEVIKDLLFIQNDIMLQGKSSDKNLANFKEKLTLLLSMEEIRDDIIEVLNEAELIPGKAINLCDLMKETLASCLPQLSKTSSIQP